MSLSELRALHNQGAPLRKKPVNAEDAIQADFFRVARLMYPQLGKLLYHACNEGRRNPSRSKRVGIVAGVPDVHLALSNGTCHSLYIEFKAGKNKQTPEQAEFQKQAEAAGNRYVICYSASEAIEELKKYLKGL
jgi:hypothetical protein